MERSDSPFNRRATVSGVAVATRSARPCLVKELLMKMKSCSSQKPSSHNLSAAPPRDLPAYRRDRFAERKRGDYLTLPPACKTSLQSFISDANPSLASPLSATRKL